MSSLQKHHIVPTYKCKELGLTTSYKIGGKEFYFKENMVEVSRLDHAYIHNGYGTSDLEPLLEVCNPPQWVIDMIPLGDKRDRASAVILAKGEIDGIDISGENNPRWKGGIWANDPVAWKKAHNEVYKQTPKYKAQQKAYRATPKEKARQKAYNDARSGTPEHKEYMRVYDQKRKSNLEHRASEKIRRETPGYKARKKAYMRVYDKKRRETPEYKARKKVYNEAYKLRKKLERQGNLNAFL